MAPNNHIDDHSDQPRRVSGGSGIPIISILAIAALVMVLFTMPCCLLGLLVPAVQNVREAAGRMESANNLKQITLAMHNADVTLKKLPPAVGWYPVSAPDWKAVPAMHGTAFYHILPFMEGEHDVAKTQYSSWNIHGMVRKEFIAPLDHTAPSNGLHHRNRGAVSYGINTYALMDYRRFAGHGYDANGYTGWAQRDVSYMSLSKIAAMDGKANTVAFGERFASCWSPVVDRAGTVSHYRKFERAWGESSQHYNNYSPAVFRPLNKGGGEDLVPPELMPQLGANQKSCEPAAYQAFGRALQVGLWDGSVRAIGPGISRETWTRALLPDDGRLLGDDW